MSDYGYCNLCTPPRRVQLDTLIEHFRLVHDAVIQIATWPDGERVIQIATWPDGEQVIIDKTLEPDDFEESS